VHLILGYQDPDNIMTPAIPVRGLPPRTLPLNSLPSIDVVTKKVFELWENTLASRGLTEDDIVKFVFSFTDGEGVRRKIAIGRSNRTFTRAIAQVARYAIIVTDTDARCSCGPCNGRFHPPWLMVAFGTLDKTGKLTHDDMITLKDLESHTKPVDALVEEEQTMLWSAQSIVAQLLNTRASPSSEPTTPRTTKVINGSQTQDPSQSAEEAHLNDLNALLNSEHEITANKTASEIVQNEIGSPTPRCRNAAPQQPRTRSRSQPTKRSFGDMYGPGTSSSDKH